MLPRVLELFRFPKEKENDVGNQKLERRHETKVFIAGIVFISFGLAWLGAQIVSSRYHETPRIVVKH